MRKILAVVGAFCLVASGAWAAENNAKQKVTYTVSPTVGFGAASTSLTGAGSPFQNGGLTLGASFLPHANSQDVRMWVCATPLFKGDSPVVANGSPNPNNIPLANQETSPAVLSGVGFTPTPQPMPLTVSSTFAYDQYTWPRACSAADAAGAATFFGGSNNSFSNPVDVSVVWASANTELPTGGYSGYIQLYVATLPLI